MKSLLSSLRRSSSSLSPYVPSSRSFASSSSQPKPLFISSLLASSQSTVLSMNSFPSNDCILSPLSIRSISTSSSSPLRKKKLTSTISKKKSHKSSSSSSSPSLGPNGPILMPLPKDVEKDVEVAPEDSDFVSFLQKKEAERAKVQQSKADGTASVPSKKSKKTLKKKSLDERSPEAASAAFFEDSGPVEADPLMRLLQSLKQRPGGMDDITSEEAEMLLIDSSSDGQVLHMSNVKSKKGKKQQMSEAEMEAEMMKGMMRLEKEDLQSKKGDDLELSIEDWLKMSEETAPVPAPTPELTPAAPNQDEMALFESSLKVPPASVLQRMEEAMAKQPAIRTLPKEIENEPDAISIRNVQMELTRSSRAVHMQSLEAEDESQYADWMAHMLTDGMPKGANTAEDIGLGEMEDIMRQAAGQPTKAAEAAAQLKEKRKVDREQREKERKQRSPEARLAAEDAAIDKLFSPPKKPSSAAAAVAAPQRVALKPIASMSSPPPPPTSDSDFFSLSESASELTVDGSVHLEQSRVHEISVDEMEERAEQSFAGSNVAVPSSQEHQKKEEKQEAEQEEESDGKKLRKKERRAASGEGSRHVFGTKDVSYDEYLSQMLAPESEERLMIPQRAYELQALMERKQREKDTPDPAAIARQKALEAQFARLGVSARKYITREGNPVIHRSPSASSLLSGSDREDENDSDSPSVYLTKLQQRIMTVLEQVMVENKGRWKVLSPDRVTVTSVKVHRDGRTARVTWRLEDAVTVTPEEKERVQSAFDKAAGYLTWRIGDRIKSKFVPKLSFVFDREADKDEALHDMFRELELSGALSELEASEKAAGRSQEDEEKEDEEPEDDFAFAKRKAAARSSRRR